MRPTDDGLRAGKTDAAKSPTPIKSSAKER